MKVAVIGTGYVGLVTGVLLANIGHQAVCVDIDEEKLKILRSGRSPLYEPGLEELLGKAIKSGSLTFTNSIPEAMKDTEMIFVAVGTPPKPDGDVDLTYFTAATQEIARHIRRHIILVNKSTVPVGTAAYSESLLEAAHVPRELYDVVSNPEFLREGTAVEDAFRPERIVIGTKKKDVAEKLIELYAPLESLVICTDPASAELTKYAANSFLAMKISYINAISRLCEITGANVGDVAMGMGADSRIGSLFLHAGLGWGGSCFPKDVQGLLHSSTRFGYDFGLLRETIRVNEEQTPHFLDRLEAAIGGFSGKTIGLIGLAFKPNTDDMRDARSLVIIDELTRRGARVKGCDPEAAKSAQRLRPDLQVVDDVDDVARNADALILVTEWVPYRHLDLPRLKSLMRGDAFFDGRRVYDRATVERAGLRYATIGE